MRRNSVTILKLLIAGIGFMIIGPLSLKYFFGSNDTAGSSIDQVARGLPHPPDEGVDLMDQHKRATDQFIHQQGALLRGAVATQLTRIDWHDYEKIAAEKSRTGPGEQGSAVILSAEEEKKKADLYKVNGFNAFASDKISLDRAILDIRHPKCHDNKYLSHLPNVSVIVPFHNEHWSSLLRTVHSVLNRSPTHLIHEIILVDDYSNKPHTKTPLDEHLASHYAGKVKVIHADKREGLIRTRLLGAHAATGEVMIFLDSHVEANTNWLPPLLEPIALDYKTVVCPFIDVIDYETFAYRAQDEGARGAFDWEFFYKRLPLQPDDLKHPSEPFKSPVMAGGLFAISTKWFWEMGGYDPGLDIWGGEQYELSFKIWQCGGIMVDAPCSRVGHIYRKFAPFPNPGVGDYVGRNYKRVAEVWMDEYAEYIYKRRPHYRSIDAGDLTEQRAIRTKLQCKPFSWFMKEVAFDLQEYYPAVEPPNFAEGELRSAAAALCVDTRFKHQNDRFGLETCISDQPGAGGEQKISLTWHHDIRPHKRTVCFDVSQSIRKAPIILYNCHGMKGNQHFKFNLDTNQLFHPISGQCLDCDTAQREIFMNPCDANLLTQQWTFSSKNETAIRQEWASR